jgi:hypothetical protein
MTFTNPVKIGIRFVTTVRLVEEPDKHLDDQIAVRPPKYASAMPMLKPELRFIPHMPTTLSHAHPSPALPGKGRIHHFFCKDRLFSTFDLLGTSISPLGGGVTIGVGLVSMTHRQCSVSNR